MEITCIGHSGFLIELPEYNLIFDYFRDKNNIIKPEIFENKKTIVFVSHNHFDHFNKKIIFNWNSFGDVIYILDKGCIAPENKNIIKVGEDEDFDILNGGINIKTYGSTDSGVSFLIKIKDFSVFHAGDLNDWYWEDESTPEELIEYEENYFNIIKKLAGIKINIAFIPEDPRLGINSGRGIKYFKEIVNPERIIPMHFPGNDGVKY